MSERRFTGPCIIAVDFDGTIADHAWPEIGDPIPYAFPVMQALQKAGHKLILWTCREDDGYKIDRQFLTDAIKFCRANGVEFDAINEGLEGEDFRSPQSKRRKPYWHYCIDDRNYGGIPGGWLGVAEFFEVEVEGVTPTTLDQETLV